MAVGGFTHLLSESGVGLPSVDAMPAVLADLVHRNFGQIKSNPRVAFPASNADYPARFLEVEKSTAQPARHMPRKRWTARGEEYGMLRRSIYLLAVTMLFDLRSAVRVRGMREGWIGTLRPASAGRGRVDIMKTRQVNRLRATTALRCMGAALLAGALAVAAAGSDIAMKNGKVVHGAIKFMVLLRSAIEESVDGADRTYRVRYTALDGASIDRIDLNGVHVTSAARVTTLDVTCLGSPPDDAEVVAVGFANVAAPGPRKLRAGSVLVEISEPHVKATHLGTLVGTVRIELVLDTANGAPKQVASGNGVRFYAAKPVPKLDHTITVQGASGTIELLVAEVVDLPAKPASDPVSGDPPRRPVAAQEPNQVKFEELPPEYRERAKALGYKEGSLVPVRRGAGGELTVLPPVEGNRVEEMKAKLTQLVISKIARKVELPLTISATLNPDDLTGYFDISFKVKDLKEDLQKQAQALGFKKDDTVDVQVDAVTWEYKIAPKSETYVATVKVEPSKEPGGQPSILSTAKFDDLPSNLQKQASQAGYKKGELVTWRQRVGEKGIEFVPPTAGESVPKAASAEPTFQVGMRHSFVSLEKKDQDKARKLGYKEDDTVWESLDRKTAKFEMVRASEVGNGPQFEMLGGLIKPGPPQRVVLVVVAKFEVLNGNMQLQARAQGYKEGNMVGLEYDPKLGQFEILGPPRTQEILSIYEKTQKKPTATPEKKN